VLWKLWAAVGAIVLGLLIPTMLGGGMPRGAALLAAAALLVGIVVTAFVGTTRRDRDGRPRRVAEAPKAPSRATDRVVIDEIARLTATRQVDWLRNEDFDGSWRGDRCLFVRDLAFLEVGYSSITNPELRRSVNHLTDVAGTFVHIHDTDSIVDPLVLDTSWLTIGRIGPDGEPEPLTEQDRLAIRGKLRAAADEVCRGIDEVHEHLGLAGDPQRASSAARPRALR
jgi:hypothetical protein